MKKLHLKSVISVRGTSDNDEASCALDIERCTSGVFTPSNAVYIYFICIIIIVYATYNRVILILTYTGCCF